MQSVSFTIPGKPFAKQRARAFGSRVYTPAETRSFEQQVGAIAAQHFGAPMVGPVFVEITATFEPAKSWSKRKREAAIGEPHTQRPDLDNCVKAILDGLNRIAWGDDGQVAELRVRKAWGETAQTMVTVSGAGA